MSFKKYWLPAMVLCWVAVGCSIREDRSGCPCRLTIGVRGGTLPVYLSLSGEGGTVEDTLRQGGFSFETNVPRGRMDVNVYAGDEGCFVPGRGLVIAQGRDCPPLWSETVAFEAREEQEALIATLHKVHCRVTLSFRKDGETVSTPFLLKVTGGVAGYALDGRPRDGTFSFVPFPDAQGRYGFCLPRQTDGSLRLEIHDESILRSFALGEYILESGYDWNAPDLDDIFLEVDYARTEVTFRMAMWKKTVHQDIVI